MSAQHEHLMVKSSDRGQPARMSAKHEHLMVKKMEACASIH
jgi:hypothetical protein